MCPHASNSPTFALCERSGMVRSSPSVNPCPAIQLHFPATHADNAGPPPPAKLFFSGVNLFFPGCHRCACSFIFRSRPQGQAKLSHPALLINRLRGHVRVHRPFSGSPLAFPSRCIRGINRILIQKRGGRPSPSPPVRALACVSPCHYPWRPCYRPRGSNPTTAWEYPSPPHPSRAPLVNPDRNPRAAWDYPRLSPPSRAPDRVSHLPASLPSRCASFPQRPLWVIASSGPPPILLSKTLLRTLIM